MRHRSETSLAVLTLALTLTHFVLETIYHFQYGQPLQALIVDYIWNALAIFAAGGQLGLCAGIWLAQYFWQAGLNRCRPGRRKWRAGLLYICTCCALCLVGVFLIWSLILAYRQARQEVSN